MPEPSEQPAMPAAAGKGVWTMGDAEYQKAKAEILATSELARMRADDEAELARIKAKYPAEEGK